MLPSTSLGIESPHTSAEDDGSAACAGRGAALATSPFLTANPNGTDLRRSGEDCDVGRLRFTVMCRS